MVNAVKPRAMERKLTEIDGRAAARRATNWQHRHDVSLRRRLAAFA
jgi:hypothetical protein